MSEDTADDSAHADLEHIFQSVNDKSADLSGKCQLVKRRRLRSHSTNCELHSPQHSDKYPTEQLASRS